jgi:hypothetical protein
MEERKDADAPAPKKTAMEIHAAWQAECQRATAAYDQTKHQYIERFQKFAQALWAAKKTEDAETGYDEELKQKAMAMPGLRCTTVTLAAGEKNWTGAYFCKGNSGTCGKQVPPYGECAICEDCGVASYCDPYR